MRLLKDPTWEFIGAIAATVILTLVVSLVILDSKLINSALNQLVLNILISLYTGSVVTLIYFRLRNRKSISLKYSVTSNVPILTKSSTDLAILYQGQPVNVNELRLITLVIQNSGNIPITPDDFSENLTLNFGEKSKVLNVDVLDKKPPSIKLKFTNTSKVLTIEPLLLNSKDSIKFALLLLGFTGEVEVNTVIRNTDQKVLERQDIL